jgi:hypothetical protein
MLQPALTSQHYVELRPIRQIARSDAPLDRAAVVAHFGRRYDPGAMNVKGGIPLAQTTLSSRRWSPSLTTETVP